MRISDPLKWVAAVFALAATSTAEYETARTIGMNEFVAVAVPGALDAYVVRSLMARQEVFAAVLAMVGVNAASHLVSVGLLPVGWQLVTAVSAIAPLVLWRVHALGKTDTPVPGASTKPVTPDTQARPWATSTPDTDLMAVADAVSAPATAVPEPDPQPIRLLKRPDTCQCEHPAGRHNEHGCYEHACPCLWVRSTLVPAPVTAQGLVSMGVLHPSDTDTYERAREHSAGTDTVPGVRALKSELGTGTARAQRVRAALLMEHEQRNGKGTS
jgi:hypothetical protein